MLASQSRGHGERLVLVHGFTQTARSWDAIAGTLACHHEVVTVDAPGHGESGHADVDLHEGARLLVGVGGEATYIGYSMGGRMCLHAAVDAPHAVRRLVLIGASPGLDDDAERSRRREDDERLATRLEAEGIDRFLDDWLALPLFAGLDEASAGHDDRRRNDAASLASSLRAAGTGAQSSLWPALHEIRCPVLLLVGEHDHKFAAVAAGMAEQIPDATVEVVAGSGHSVHLEQAQEFLERLQAWLDRHPPSASPTAASAP